MLNKEKYYIAQGNDEDKPWIYKGNTPPKFYTNDKGKHLSCSTDGCILVGSISKGFINPGECKELVIYTKDIK